MQFDLFPPNRIDTLLYQIDRDRARLAVLGPALPAADVLALMGEWALFGRTLDRLLETARRAALNAPVPKPPRMRCEPHPHPTRRWAHQGHAKGAAVRTNALPSAVRGEAVVASLLLARVPVPGVGGTATG